MRAYISCDFWINTDTIGKIDNFNFNWNEMRSIEKFKFWKKEVIWYFLGAVVEGWNLGNFEFYAKSLSCQVKHENFCIFEIRELYDVYVANKVSKICEQVWIYNWNCDTCHQLPLIVKCRTMLTKSLILITKLKFQMRNISHSIYS